MQFKTVSDFYNKIFKENKVYRIGIGTIFKKHKKLLLRKKNLYKVSNYLINFLSENHYITLFNI